MMVEINGRALHTGGLPASRVTALRLFGAEPFRAPPPREGDPHSLSFVFSRLLHIWTSPSDNDWWFLYDKLSKLLCCISPPSTSSSSSSSSALRQKPTGELVHILSSYFVSSLPLMTQSFSPRSIRLSSRGSCTERMVNPILFPLF